jgi:sialate O-acetylesterase
MNLRRVCCQLLGSSFGWLLFVCIVTPAFAEVSLPKIFSDNMVLQRDRALKVWGWAAPNEGVTVSFNGQSVKAKADRNGSWYVAFKPMAYGGPFAMSIKGKSNTISYKNILIGDVWICSGQSNMEWTMKSTNQAEKEIAESNYPKIRLFNVQKAMSYSPKNDLAGGSWLECTPQTVGDFSAVAYFFGRKLVKELDIPMGLINSSWGGTNIQTWISWDIMSQKGDYKQVDLKSLETMTTNHQANRDKYEAALRQDRGLSEKWYESSAPVDEWKKATIPNEFAHTPIGNNDGIAWFRRDFDIPAGVEAKNAVLHLGPIDDTDNTYVNGKQVGSEVEWNKDRVYAISNGLLKAGKNTLVVKVTDTGGGGGLNGKPDQLYLEVDGKRISLAGEWLCRPSVLTSEFGIKDLGPNTFPSQLYNAMIAPITAYAIKGGLWYQGESNAHEAYAYRTLFPELINNWRNKWGYEFPFFWVQLANFQAADAQPVESDWAELREAQSKTLALPQTGQAVIIDIGEAYDIHPRNKQDVGLRLAISALKVAYGKDVVYSGPVYQSMKVEGNKVVLSFANTGTGLITKDKYGYVSGFAVAGADKKFVWAKGYIEGNTVVVYSESVASPVAVRYAWGNNPDDASLYNKELLPASPFRTDTWPGITGGK